MRTTLTALSLLFTIAIAHAEPATQPAGVEKVSIDQFDKLRSDGRHVILDVRTPQEFTAGHVPGAVNVPFSKTEFEKSIASLDKSKQYVVYCHSGKRSFLATQQMQAAGFDKLLNFNGGFAGWEAANKPVETGAAEPATKPS